MGAFGMGGYLGCAWAASALIPSGLVALLSATAPLFVALGERLIFGRHLAAQAWVGLALGWLGVAVLGLPRAASGLEAAAAGGIVLALAGALSQAGGLLAFAPARGRLDPWMSNLGQMAVAAIAVTPFALLLEPVPVAVPAFIAVAAFAWSILVVGLGGYALYFVLLRRLPASSAAALQLLAPPVAALIGWACWESLRVTDLAGGAVTLAGLTMLLRAPRERAVGEGALPLSKPLPARVQCTLDCRDSAWGMMAAPMQWSAPRAREYMSLSRNSHRPERQVMVSKGPGRG